MATDYRTVQGDTFDTIAYRLFNDEHLCGDIMRANPEEIDVIFFQAGTVIKIPEIKKRIPQSDLPPWYGDES